MREPSVMSKSRYKKPRTLVFNVCKAIDYTMSMDANNPNLFTIFDVSGNYMGCMSADEWLVLIKTAMRSAKRC